MSYQQPNSILPRFFFNWFETGLCLSVSLDSSDFFSCSSSFHNHHSDSHSLSSGYIKKYHNRNLFLTFREAGKSKIKVPADLVSGKSCLLVHTQSSSHRILIRRGPESILGSRLHGTKSLHEGSTLMTSSPLKGPTS